MKKGLLFIMLLMTAMSSWAITVGNYIYDITKEPSGSTYGQVELIGLRLMVKVENDIPGVVTYNNKKYYVTSIADYAFRDCETSKVLEIPYGVQKIGKRAFYRCRDLKNVYIPSSVTEFSSDIFLDSGVATIYYSGLHPEWITSDSGESTFVSDPSKVELVLTQGADYSLFKGKKMWNTFNKVSYSVNVRDFSRAYLEHNDYQLYNYVCTSKFNPNNSPSNRIDAVLTFFSGNYASPTQNRDIDDKYIKVVGILPHAFSTDELQILDLTDLTNITVLPESLCEDATNLRTVKLGNISEIDNHAFRNCSSLTDLQIDESVTPLMKIGDGAFVNTGLTQLILPFGVCQIGSRAFANSKIKKLLVPCTYFASNNNAFADMNSLEELYLNSRAAYNASLGWGTIPLSATIYVPVGYVNQYRAAFKNYSPKIEAGAYDFTNTTVAQSQYATAYISIDQLTPFTINGVTYDGTAKYVYNKNLRTNRSFTTRVAETNTYYNMGKKYYMREVEDSCFMGAKLDLGVNLGDNIERIGHHAFYGTGIKSITLPKSVNYIGEYAFALATNLEDVTITSSTLPEYGGQFFGANADNFNLYVPFDRFHEWYYNSDFISWKFSSATTRTCDYYLGVYIYPQQYSTLNLGCAGSYNVSDSGLKGYFVKSADKNTKKLTTEEITYVVGGDHGVLLTGLEPGKSYKLHHVTANIQRTQNRLTSVNQSTVELRNHANSYYWDASQKKFIKARYERVYPGYCYMTLDNSDVSEYTLDIDIPDAGKKGDVNGDGVVDISDANILINILLGQDSASKYAGRADVTGDGVIDISDVNSCINIVLGKS